MPDIDRLSKRPGEYLWETGVAPLTAGLCFFLLGASDLLKRFLPQTGLAQNGMKWLAICAVAAVFWGMRSIKGRVVLPRGGYVEPWVPWWLPLLLLPIFLAPLVLDYVLTANGRPHDFSAYLDNDRLIVPGFAVWFAAGSLYEARKRKSSPLLAYGLYLMCLAPLTGWLPLSPTERFGLLQSGAGGPLAVFGAMRLRAFAKANPDPVDLTSGG